MNEDKKTEVVGMLSDEKYIKMHEQSRRVYGTDGLAPTIHTCGGGNLEPKIMCDVIQKPRGKNKGGVTGKEVCPTITSNAFEQNVLVGTNEPSIIEGFYAGREPREYKDLAPTLRSEREGLKVVEPVAYDCYNHSLCPDGMINTVRPQFSRKDITSNGTKIIEPVRNADELHVYQYPRGYNPGGEIRNDIFPTLREDNTARYTNAIAEESDYRVRKLTPKECWRLMGFSDEDFEKAKASGVSNSQLYKQAGNSIVVNVLVEVFKTLINKEKNNG